MWYLVLRKLLKSRCCLFFTAVNNVPMNVLQKQSAKTMKPCKHEGGGKSCSVKINNETVALSFSFMQDECT